MASFSVTLGNVLLMLLYMLPGFLLCKFRKIGPEHLGSFGTILLYVCAPCLFISSLTAMDPAPEMTGSMLQCLVLSFLAELVLLLLIFALAGKRRGEFRWRMLAIAGVSGNAGFFGLPIISALFPDQPEVAAYSCVFCVSLNILAWTVGIFALTGDKKYISLKAAFLNPVVIGVAVGFVLYLLRAKDWMPGLIRTGIKAVSGMSTPLCLFGLGIRLAVMDPKKLFTQPFVYAAAAVKLVVFPLFCFALANLLPFSPVFRASMLILGAAPCASAVLNLAEMHNSGQSMAANCLLLTTILSVVTIPLMSLLI